MDAKLKHELCELLYVSVEGIATSAQMDRLNTLLETDPEALSYSMDFYLLSSALKKTNTIADAFLGTKNEKIEQLDLLQCLAMEERIAPPVEIASTAKEPEPAAELVSHVLVREPHRVSRASFVAGVMSLAALLFMLAYVHFVPSREAVAKLVNVMDIQVKKGFQSFAKGDRFYNTDKPYRVESGLLEIAFEYGATVILEGPCEFACKSNGSLELMYGSVYAMVPQEASGFTIETPSSRVVDLGTEFGVQVEPDGSSSVDVFKGRTRLVSTLLPKEKSSEMLEARQSRKVNAVTGMIMNAGFEENNFVRYFNPEKSIVLRGSIIDLANIVGGGNGIDAVLPERGIDPSTGKMKAFTDFSGQLDGPREFVRVSGNPFIDGVFTPSAGLKPPVISSRGHVFESCPETNGRYWGGIINGAHHQAQLLGIPKHPLRLNAVTYGTLETSSIYMHANQGITFDLEAIRAAYSRLSINRFTAVCGISESLNDYHDRLQVWTNRWNKLEPDSSNADFYVLVDGQVRFAARSVSVRNGATDISVDIHPGDRFLTLITTQGNDPWGNTNDWTLFGEPVLHVSPSSY